MNNEQERAAFEAFASIHGLCITCEDDMYRSHVVNWMWRAWQARAALQSQKPEPNDLMLSGVLRMPFDMAMATEISRVQFYHRAQQALNELEALQAQDREDEVVFQLAIEDEVQAQAFGPREQAWAEIQRYAAQYVEDGPIEMWEVTRRRIEDES